MKKMGMIRKCGVWVATLSATAAGCTAVVGIDKDYYPIGDGRGPPSCMDMLQDGTETDVDCGGQCAALPVPQKCLTGKKCLGAGDCLGGVCMAGICQPSCTDQQENQDETLCTAAGKQCGTYTGADNCGVTRSIDCGDTCISPQTCDTSTNHCHCVSQMSDAELCASMHFTCAAAMIIDECSVSRSVDCGTCGAGMCVSSAHACVCDSAKYGNLPPSPTADGNGDYQPNTDSLIDDVPLVNDAGTMRGCTQNTTAAIEAHCVSIRGTQQHFLGMTADGSVLGVFRSGAGGCGVHYVWLYEGTFSPQSYTGIEVSTVLQNNAVPLNEGQVTLNPDGLGIVAGDYARFVESRRSAIGASDFGAPSAAAFTAVNALGNVSSPAFNADGWLLFFVKAGTPNEIWQAHRDSAGHYVNPIKLPGTATDQINDGTWWMVTGATADGLTLLVHKNFQTYTFTRSAVDQAPALLHGPFYTWYARPLAGCGAFIGTQTPGGCQSEGIGTLVYNW